MIFKKSIIASAVCYETHPSHPHAGLMHIVVWRPHPPQALVARSSKVLSLDLLLD